MNIQQALARSYPADPESLPSYSLEAQLLLAEATGHTRAWILAHPESDLTVEQETRYGLQLQLIQSGTPLAYILGRQEFFGRTFKVSRATLIPRPETELLIETALAITRNYPAGFHMVDVGTGSGCIGITMACEDPTLRVVAVDPSHAALRVARINADNHKVSDRWSMLQTSLLDPIVGRFMLICANLPYIPSGRLQGLEVSRNEPRLALDGGEDGMRYTRSLILQLWRCLHPAGSAILEIDDGQADALGQLVGELLPARPVSVYRDISGQERVLEIGPERG